MNRQLAISTLALTLLAVAPTARANMAVEIEDLCWGSEVCDSCHYRSYTGVCLDLNGCGDLGNDDDAAEDDCYLECVTNADNEHLDQCPDVELPSCECSAAGVAGVSGVPALLLLIGLAAARRRRKPRE